MAPRTPFTRSPVVLVANAGTWLNQALDSMLEPLGYRVVSVGSGRELLDRAPAARPDVILMDANLQDLDSLAVCRALRQNRAVSWHTPIFMITSTPATKQQRLAALEAGAWDYLSLVLNAEELALKLDAFTRVKLETDHALDEGAVEPASGLYTMRGLERRARELVSDAFRRHAPLACLALAVELVLQDANPARLAAPPVAVAYAAHVLQARGRTSDAIGRLGRSEFAVLAPSTAPEGADLMARRLTQALETAGPRPAGLPPLLVRAGYEAVADLHATPLAPDRLLEHAGAALVQARAAGSGERIRAYQG
ncbi:MAG TPA: response regulator [Gemmatimonadales bacterium]|nr:response regulator [Gemmatimonadales bacterium]